ncbi:hypothetical protein TNCV_1734121 [Trichonephila clavipes]|nr:hypothetical protein TNCV_1734121 [Trichonephila clavipes]
MVVKCNFENGSRRDVEGQEQNPSWVPDAPRKAAVVHFRFLIGHDCLRSHPYRIGIVDPPDSTLCDSGQPMTTEHSDVGLPLISLNSIIEKYWKARALMA